MSVIRTEPPQAAVDRLRHAMELRRQADIEEVAAVAQLADEHGWTTDDEFDVVGERPVRLGADGTRLVGEFLPLEVAAIMGTSVTTATWLIRDVLNLEARHPALWQAVSQGRVRPYQAFQITQLAAKYELSVEQAQAVDTHLASKLGRIGWARVLKLARGLIGVIAADKLREAAERARQARFVRANPTDEPLVSELHARIDTADAQVLEATIQAIAGTLKTLGDTDELDVRRARALGILSTPHRAAALLDDHDDDRHRPRTQVYLHLNGSHLTGTDTDTGTDGAGNRIARSETLGPITHAQLADLFGTHQVRITPVIHEGSEPGVDSYEIPARIRESVVLRDGVEAFPYSARTARGLDLDHTVPYVTGVENQTRPDNLAPLTRKVHRAKTSGRWTLRQPANGVLWWCSPHRQTYRTTRNGTDDFHHWSPAERLIRWHLDAHPPPAHA